MQIAILKIGTSEYAFKKTGEATKVLDLLSQAMQVESEHREGQGYVYVPVEDADAIRYRGQLELKMIPASQLELPIKRAPKSRRLPAPSPTGLEGLE